MSQENLKAFPEVLKETVAQKHVDLLGVGSGRRGA
jgi:hypothetical protein